MILLVGAIVGVFIWRRKKHRGKTEGTDRSDDNIAAPHDAEQGVPTPKVYDHGTSPLYDEGETTMMPPVLVATGMKTTPQTKVGIALARCADNDSICVSQISEQSIFAGQGLQVGMVVRTINGEPVKTVEHASSIIRNYQGVLTIEAELKQGPMVEGSF